MSKIFNDYSNDNSPSQISDDENELVQITNINQITNKKLDRIALEIFLVELFQDLIRRSTENSKDLDSISKLAFCESLNLPLIISERIFYAFVNNINSKEITKTEYIQGFVGLFTDDIDRKIDLIAKIFDFDLDGVLIVDDITLLFAEFYTIENDIETFSEVKKIIHKDLQPRKRMSVNNFKEIINYFNPDAFYLFILYLNIYCPFTEDQVNFFSEVNNTGNERPNSINNNNVGNNNNIHRVYSPKKGKIKNYVYNVGKQISQNTRKNIDIAPSQLLIDFLKLKFNIVYNTKKNNVNNINNIKNININLEKAKANDNNTSNTSSSHNNIFNNSSSNENNKNSNKQNSNSNSFYGYDKLAKQQVSNHTVVEDLSDESGKDSDLEDLDAFEEDLTTAMSKLDFRRKDNDTETVNYSNCRDDNNDDLSQLETPKLGCPCFEKIKIHSNNNNSNTCNNENDNNDFSCMNSNNDKSISINSITKQSLQYPYSPNKHTSNNISNNNNNNYNINNQSPNNPNKKINLNYLPPQINGNSTLVSILPQFGTVTSSEIDPLLRKAALFSKNPHSPTKYLTLGDSSFIHHKFSASNEKNKKSNSYNLISKGKKINTIIKVKSLVGSAKDRSFNIDNECIYPNHHYELNVNYYTKSGAIREGKVILIDDCLFILIFNGIIYKFLKLFTLKFTYVEEIEKCETLSNKILIRIRLSSMLNYCYKEMILSSQDQIEMKSFLSKLELLTKKSKLEDKYTKIKEIYRGSMSNIYLGKLNNNENTNDTYNTYKESENKINYVAIKQICFSNLSKRQSYEPILWEIDIMKFIHNTNHKNIVKVYDFYRTHDCYYFVIDYLPDGNLKNYLLEKRNRLSAKEINNIVIQISKAIYFLHSHGIIHRDLKPENILVKRTKKEGEKGENLEIKLIDFGFSRVLGKLNVVNESYGTFFYASPEVLNKTPYNFKTDIWSFGVILYYIVYGIHPFGENGNDLSKIHQNIIKSKYKFPDKIYIDKKYKHIIQGCLKIDPKERPKMDDILELLCYDLHDDLHKEDG